MNSPTGSSNSASLFPLYTTTMHLFSTRRWVTVNETTTLSKEVPTFAFAPLARFLFTSWGNTWNTYASSNNLTSFAAGSMLIIAIFLAFGFDSIISMIWELRHNKLSVENSPSEETITNGKHSVRNPNVLVDTPKESWQSTFVYGLTHSITTAARVYLCLIVTEVVLEWFPRVTQLPLLVSHSSGHLESLRLQEAAPIVAFIIWMGLTFGTVKRIILLQSLNHSAKKHPPQHSAKPPHVSGRVVLFNRLLDIVIYFMMATFVLNEISVDTSTNNFVLHSLLSAGGIGALILSFATKDLATEIVGGVALGVWNIFNVGDRVRLDNGISGKVLEIGLVETIIQSYDNIITRIPNSQLTKSRISNLSRCPRSRLRQNLRFKHDDMDKLPALLADIKEEIVLSCPKVISDGSKSFHAVVTSFEVDHIQAMVLAHFEIQPVTAEFIRNRHDVLFAIARAMKKHQVEFAIPPVIYGNNTPLNGRPDPADYSY